jgi:apolipoprotein N-acyltransferase
LIRVAQSGISANINHYGQVVDKILLNQKGVIDVKVFQNKKTTFYSQNYNWILAIFFLPVLLIIFFKKSK